ncbi:alpha/beta hydrolase [bacterium]|nr:alpha/beta hydrolase [bacterium]
MRRPLALAAALLVAGGCAAVENRIVFFPHPYPIGDWTPDPRVEDVWIDSPDGARLHGWLATPDGDPRAVVLFCHGNGRNVTTRRHVLELYRDRMNATVLVFDYRGYGKSTGRPTEAGVLLDARAARRWLAARTGVPEGDVVIAGHSLGGGVAVDLAAGDGARALVLEGTFTNLPDVADHHVPLIPMRPLMLAELNSLRKIPNYRGPLLQVHGDADRIVPYELGRRLFVAGNEPKEFVTVPNGNHNDLYTPAFVAALDRFLAALPRPAATGPAPEK